MPKRFLLFILVFLVLAVAGISYWYFTRPTWQTYQNNELGVKFYWPDNFQRVPLSNAERDSGMVFKIERENPEAQVFLRVEKDLGPVRFTGKTILEYLIEVIDRTYPQRFPEFYKEDQRRFVLAGKNAEEFTFTYRSLDGETIIRQRYIVIVKNEENTAFFLSLQTPGDQYSGSETEFEQIIDSLVFLEGGDN